MTNPACRGLKIALSVAMVVGLSACGLPRSGPYFEEIVTEPSPDLPFEVVDVTPEIARITRIDEAAQFAVTFTEAQPENTALIARGDQLQVTVWENIDEGLLNPQGIGASALPTSTVDERGRIFVPYVGLVRAAGRTVNQLREAIRSVLSDKTLNPQVEVQLVESTERVVSISGTGTNGLFPIRKPTTRLLEMIAQAGGIPFEAEIARVKLRRDGVLGEIALQDLYDNPENNIPVRTGDQIIVERDRRIFTALGAVGATTTVNFPTRDLSVIRALGSVGGLSETRADPTGIFVFREEPPEIATRLFPTRESQEPLRVAYILDLTQPGGMFLAADFMMRNNDTLFVTTAPFVRVQQVLSSIAPLISFAGTTRSLGGF